MVNNQIVLSTIQEDGEDNWRPRPATKPPGARQRAASRRCEHGDRFTGGIGRQLRAAILSVFNRVINLSLPYQERGEQPWIEFMEAAFGGDFYFVHFNRQPGVADTVLDDNTFQFLRNLYRKNVPLAEPEPGMAMINLATAAAPLGEPVMSDDELAVFVSAYGSTGFTSSINWYRNMDRNWHLLADVNPVIEQPTLMVYGDQDLIPKSDNLNHFVPNVEVVSLDCGHWIQQERPEETNRAILKWLEQDDATHWSG